MAVADRYSKLNRVSHSRVAQSDKPCKKCGKVGLPSYRRKYCHACVPPSKYKNAREASSRTYKKEKEAWDSLSREEQRMAMVRFALDYLTSLDSVEGNLR